MILPQLSTTRYSGAGAEGETSSSCLENSGRLLLTVLIVCRLYSSWLCSPVDQHQAISTAAASRVAIMTALQVQALLLQA